MESFRSQHNLEKGFSDKLAHATDLVRNLVPIRCVNLSMAKKIAENDGVYSLRSAVEEGLFSEGKYDMIQVGKLENHLVDQGLDSENYFGAIPLSQQLPWYHVRPSIIASQLDRRYNLLRNRMKNK